MRPALPLCVSLFLLALSSATQAQRVFERGPFGLTVEAYANATAAQNVSEDNAVDPKRYAARIDAGLLAISEWGRLELGKRRGLPNVLTGYAPNAYTFTSAEFGLSSGRTLDPSGNLPMSRRRGAGGKAASRSRRGPKNRGVGSSGCYRQASFASTTSMNMCCGSAVRTRVPKGPEPWRAQTPSTTCVR